jgi:hypothetical protein
MRAHGRYFHEIAEMFHDALKREGIICDILPVGDGGEYIYIYIHIYVSWMHMIRHATSNNNSNYDLEGRKTKKTLVRHTRFTCSSHNTPRPLSDKRMYTGSALYSIGFFHITTTHTKSFYLVTCYNSIVFDILVVLSVFNKALLTAFLFCMLTLEKFHWSFGQTHLVQK